MQEQCLEIQYTETHSLNAWSLADQVIETRVWDLAAQSRSLRACFRSYTRSLVSFVHYEVRSPCHSLLPLNCDPKETTPSGLFSLVLAQCCGKLTRVHDQAGFWAKLKSCLAVESCSSTSLSFLSVLCLTVATSSLELEYLFKDVYSVHTTKNRHGASLQQRKGLFSIQSWKPSAYYKS